jgi:hypothetical protein
MDYSKFHFPPYEFHEYPKWVESDDGPVIVESADEEAALKSADEPAKRTRKVK